MQIYQNFMCLIISCTK
uniref:Uncharacterized protein n=1 Tax=Arundo donax TaxID=35708 RepID=A0A0A9FFR9_ARUDO